MTRARKSRVVRGLGMMGTLAVIASCNASPTTPTRPDAGDGDPSSLPSWDPNGNTNWVAPSLEEPASASGPFVGDSARAARVDPASKPEIDALLADRPVASAAELAARYPLRLYRGVGYDPRQAAGLDTIQHSRLALDEGERGLLARHGFALSEKQRFPTFGYGYIALYGADLPLYISADSVLFALHRSYDAILLELERSSLIPELEATLVAMRTALGAGAGTALGTTARADADLYLAVALALLTDQPAAPVAGADATGITALVAQAKGAQGASTLDLFGTPRVVDLSQFTPRGHYTGDRRLEQYFRAMIWLGRIEMRLISPEQRFDRRQFLAAYAVRDAMDGATLARWSKIDQAVAAFVGEPDDLHLPMLDALLRDLGLASPAGLPALSDTALEAALRAGRYGQQRIASQILAGDDMGGTAPLPVSFMLFGQRYTLDAHVFSNVVYDRVSLDPPRYLPDPLDAAFAALGNDHAGLLLGDQLATFGYAPALHRMRVLADAHEDSFWHKNLYNRWLTALRTLSPREALAPGQTAGLPRVALTEPWSRRVLNTQLASWAELRHDTILYAKQSYTAGSVCEFPDAYVDPYPAFYGAVAAFADHGRQVVTELGLLPASPTLAYFTRLGTVARTLRHMAEMQRRGEPFGAAEMDFVNRTVSASGGGCGDPGTLTGWYADLFYPGAQPLEFDPSIADVHTDPNLPSVLHVATGSARLMVVTADTCRGPRAYAGLASSYFERYAEGIDRWTDERWSTLLYRSTPPDVRWMRDLVAR